jgi:hypothetical protein
MFEYYYMIVIFFNLTNIIAILQHEFDIYFFMNKNFLTDLEQIVPFIITGIFQKFTTNVNIFCTGFLLYITITDDVFVGFLLCGY